MERTPRRMMAMNVASNRFSSFSRPESATRQMPTQCQYENDSGGQRLMGPNSSFSLETSSSSSPIIFDASTNKKGGLTFDSIQSHSQNQMQSNCHGHLQGQRQVGKDRERMKEILADSFSRNETISILPGFKDEKMQSKPCIKLGQSSSHTMNLTLADKPPFAYNSCPSQNRIISSTSDPRYDNSHIHSHSQTSSNLDSSPRRHHNTHSHPHPHSHPHTNNDPGQKLEQPWPYGKQKSQRSIREAQAAYKRDLDRQVEEKRKSRDRPMRKSVITNTPVPAQTSAAALTSNKSAVSIHHRQSVSPEHHKAQPLNQSVSLEAFRNTGFLPAWFDPIRNNPLCQDHSPSDDPGDGGGGDHQNDHSDNQTQYLNPKVPVEFHTNMTPVPLQFPPGSPRSHPNPSAAPSGNYYIVSQEMINQLTQQQNQNMNLSQIWSHPLACQSHQKPRSQPPNQHQQPPLNLNSHSSHDIQNQNTNQWTPWLNPTTPPPSTTTHPITMSVCTPMTKGQNFGPSSVPVPIPIQAPAPISNLAPPTIEKGSDDLNFSVKQKMESQLKVDSEDNCDSTALQSNQIHWNSTSTSTLIGNNLEQSFGTMEENPRTSENTPRFEDEGIENYSFIETPHVSQTASQRPDELKMKTRYKSQLAKQIEEKKRLEQEKLERQEEEDAKFQRKIEEDQRRMTQEYEEEQRQHKIRQEEYKKRQELILKEKERFDREAEEQRNRKKMERRRSKIKTPAREIQMVQQRGNGDGRNCMYESPIDLTLCAASKWTTEERAKSPQKSESSESQTSEPPGTFSNESPRPRTVILSHHRGSSSVEGNKEKKLEEKRFRGPNNPSPSPIEDVSFLLDIRNAIVAEDNRIEEILKKKERFFVTF